MALIKTKETTLGIEANYWKITMISIDRASKNGSFSLSLYTKKGAKDFIESTATIIFEDEEKFKECFENSSYKDIYTSIYEYTKKNVEYFTDAEDDEEEKLYKESLKKKLKR